MEPVTFNMFMHRNKINDDGYYRDFFFCQYRVVRKCNIDTGGSGSSDSKCS